MKLGVAKLGVGEHTRVQVRLRNKAKLAGYISEVREDGFFIADLNTGEVTAVAYADVKRIRGQNMTKGTKIAIAVGIGVAILLIAVIIANVTGPD